MKKKGLALLTAAVSCWLSASGIANAEDQIHYGFGDGDNTGNISGVKLVLDKNYSFYPQPPLTPQSDLRQYAIFPTKSVVYPKSL